MVMKKTSVFLQEKFRNILTYKCYYEISNRGVAY